MTVTCKWTVVWMIPPVGRKLGTISIITGAVFDLPWILGVGEPFHVMGRLGEGCLILPLRTDGVLRPSADLVGPGWHGFSRSSGGVSVAGGLGMCTKMFTGCDGGRGIRMETLPGLLGGSRIKFGGPWVVACMVLGGFLRCHGCHGPEGLWSCCVLTGTGGNGGLGHITIQGGGGGGIGGGTTTAFSHGATSGTTKTKPELHLQYRVTTNVAVIPSTKVAKMITSTSVHVTSTAAIHFKWGAAVLNRLSKQWLWEVHIGINLSPELATTWPQKWRKQNNFTW